jgi:hypothetical protein
VVVGWGAAGSGSGASLALGTCTARAPRGQRTLRVRLPHRQPRIPGTQDRAPHPSRTRRRPILPPQLQKKVRFERDGPSAFLGRRRTPEVGSPVARWTHNPSGRRLGRRRIRIGRVACPGHLHCAGSERSTHPTGAPPPSSTAHSRHPGPRAASLPNPSSPHPAPATPKEGPFRKRRTFCFLGP